MNERNSVPVLELRRLLYELKDLRPDILIRFRLLGEMWQPGFHKIVRVTEAGVILSNESSDQFFSIRDLNRIMQFEIESAFQVYQPHNHYEVQPEKQPSQYWEE